MTTPLGPVPVLPQPGHDQTKSASLETDHSFKFISPAGIHHSTHLSLHLVNGQWLLTDLLKPVEN